LETLVRLCKFNGFLVVLLSITAGARAQGKTVVERLGYPTDAKLLIVHADDLAVAHAVDAASFDALDKAGVTSASIMVPCPWLNEVAAYAKNHPDADLGLHLTLTSEWKIYRWGPVESKDKVGSLLDPSGYLWPETGLAVQNIKAEEAEREIRAQVERAIAAGIHPTHLDSHMGVLFARPDLFAAYAKVAHDYHLPFLAVKVTDERAKLLSLLSEKDPIVDSIVMANPTVHAGQWKESYEDAMRNLRPGLSEMIVHLGYDDAELQAVALDHPDFGSAWRQRDYDFVTSSEFKKMIEENHIIPIKWRDLQKLLK
jgi:chitin disaccharide deacetylase